MNSEPVNAPGTQNPNRDAQAFQQAKTEAGVSNLASMIPIPAAKTITATTIVHAAKQKVAKTVVNSAVKKTYQTYTKKNETTGETYSGRTSGTGTPAQNVADRDKSHHMDDKGFGKAKLDETSYNPDAIRGREQQMINVNGGAQSTGGTSGNSINGVGPNNPNAAKYEAAANKEFIPPKKIN